MSRRLLVGTRKGLFTLKKTRAGWEIQKADFLGDPVSIAINDPRTGYMYAALDHGHFGAKLHRSTDAGASWSEVAAPEYPEAPKGHIEKDQMGREIPWSLMKIWALAPGGVSQAGVMWCGTMPGGLFRSADAGASWEMVRSLWDHPKRLLWFGGGADYPVIHSILVDPRSEDRVFAGVSCGGMWMTPDGGKTWKIRSEGMRAEFMPPEQARDPYIQDPHAVAQCRAEPDKLWAQHHNGIFRSVDGGASWTEIEEAGPSTFGFPVVVHPQHGDTAWFVPAVKDEKRYPGGGRVVVTRTRDGGASFDVLTEGLPQQDAYDLVYRHAMDIDSAGEQLAMGSTTGSLWVSADQGDSWTHLSAHLPPIYSVRFA